MLILFSTSVPLLSWRTAEVFLVYVLVCEQNLHECQHYCREDIDTCRLPNKQDSIFPQFI